MYWLPWLPEALSIATGGRSAGLGPFLLMPVWEPLRKSSSSSSSSSGSSSSSSSGSGEKENEEKGPIGKSMLNGGRYERNLRTSSPPPPPPPHMQNRLSPRQRAWRRPPHSFPAPLKLEHASPCCCAQVALVTCRGLQCLLIRDGFPGGEMGAQEAASAASWQCSCADVFRCNKNSRRLHLALHQRRYG